MPTKKSISGKVRKRSSDDAASTDLQQLQAPPSLAAAAAAACSLGENSNATAHAPDLFGLIGEDAHRLILGFALGFVTRRHPKFWKSSWNHFYQEQTNAGAEMSTVAGPLYAQWGHMSEQERAPYIELAAQDKARYKKETEEFELWSPKGLAKSCADFSLVSRLWRDVTGDVMNVQAPAGIIAPRELAKLKAGVAGLDLASVCQSFIGAVKKEWIAVGWPSSDESYWDCNCHGCLSKQKIVRSNPLHAFVEKFGGSYDAFAKIVSIEYTRFLVVKGVETIAAKSTNASPSTLASWKEQCKPSMLVDMFWQAHMRSSLKYAKDCIKLTGDLLDFDAVNVSDNPDDDIDVGILRSDYKSKKDTLFEFEKQLPLSIRNLRATYLVADENFNFVDQVSDILESHECHDDSYYHNYGGYHLSDSDGPY